MKSCTPVFLHSFMVGSMLGHAYPKQFIIIYYYYVYVIYLLFYSKDAAAVAQSEQQQQPLPSFTYLPYLLILIFLSYGLSHMIL